MIFNQVQGVGNGLFLRVITVSDASELPSFARDGTLSVISTVSARTVHVQNTTPSKPMEGDVWITVAEDSNAPIQFGTVTLYPSSFKQYVGGSWVPVVGYVRSNGEWVALKLWLFKTGDECSIVTGGWRRDDTHDITITGSENLTITTTEPDVGWGHSTIVTLGSIPFGKYRTMRITYKALNAFSSLVVKIASNTDLDADIAYYSAGLGRTDPDTWRTVDLDISALDSGLNGHLNIRLTSNGYQDAGSTYTAIFSEIVLLS